MTGKKRNCASKIEQLLALFPAVAIIGARQTGKTTIAKQLCPEWAYKDLQYPDNFDQITHDPGFFFQQHPKHVILDEAQLHPPIFDILRHVIDENRSQTGRFLITGSSSPELLSGLTESLAGRIAIVHISPFKMNEYYNQPLSPFYEGFKTKLDATHFEKLTPQLTTAQLTHLFLKGGYPEPLLNSNPIFFGVWQENYIQSYIHRDISALFPKLNLVAFRRFISTLSTLSGTIINKSELARAIEVDEKTIRTYLEIAEGTFVWKNLQSFERNSLKSVIKMPKGYFRDAGIHHFLQKIQTEEELFSHPHIGNSFESFVIEEILRGLESTFITNWDSYYYRTRSGAEVDLILEGPFGLLPIEIKYGSTTQRSKLIALTQFIKHHNLKFGLLINQSQKVEWITPEILQVPATCL